MGEYEGSFLQHDCWCMGNRKIVAIKYVWVTREIIARTKGGISKTKDDGKMCCAAF